MEKLQLSRQSFRQLVRKMDNPEFPTDESLLMFLFGTPTAIAVFIELVKWLPYSKRPDGSIYKSDAELGAAIRRSAKSVGRARQILKEAGFTIYIKKANGTPTNHYRFDEEKFLQFMANKLNTNVETLREWFKTAKKVQHQPAFEEKYTSTEYVEWAIAKLTRKEKLFLKTFIEVVQSKENPTWGEIREKAGIVSEQIYLERLKNLKLFVIEPEGRIIRNAAITLEMLVVPNVRHISKSLRFDVFQRDHHTCQYCGRTPPDVVLVVDHIIPISQNGTDDFDNLITSCEECNAGKSNKLIQNFTGGYSKEEWREQLRKKRSEILRVRRERIEEVMLHWQEVLGSPNLKDTDREAVLTFIEQYEPDWIKAAIRIASEKKPDDYVKYIAAILRNWAKNGSPDYNTPPNPNDDLASQHATERQIEYIQILLE
jgi:DnaD/phage-associated family protein